MIPFILICLFLEIARPSACERTSAGISTISEQIYHTEGSQSATPSSLSESSKCSEALSLCPACNWQEVTYINSHGGHQSFSVFCNSTISDGQYYSNVHAASPRQCMEACEDLAGCVGVVLGPQENSCSLAKGGNANITRHEDYTALVPTLYTLSPPHVASLSLALSQHHSTNQRSSSQHSSSHHSSSQQSMKSGNPIASGTKTTSSTSACSTTAVSCPQCDDTDIKDAVGKTYHVFCDSKLFSERNYAVQRWLTPNGCIAECDNFTWCEGATFYGNGDCQLAKGEDVFPMGDTGYTAFLPVNSTYSTATAIGPPSAYPTGNVPQQSPTPTGIPNACERLELSCPECEGLTLSDGLNATYRVRCNFQPMCNDITNRYARTSQKSCLEHCDTDTTCVAAIWDNGRCGLCEGLLEGLDTYQSPPGYVVFVAEPDLDALKPTSTHRASAPSSFHSSRRPNKPSSMTSISVTLTSKFGIAPSAVPTADIDLVSCPSYQNVVVADPTNGRHYDVQCATGFGAASQHSISASNFAACAASCIGDCGGIQLASKTSCGLFTSISVVTPFAGATAGVYIMHPNSDKVSRTLTSTTSEKISITSEFYDGTATQGKS